MSSSGIKKKSLTDKQIYVCFLMNNWCAASLRACMCVWWCLHITVCPIVCLCVILSACFKGVCFPWSLSLFPIARVRACLLTAHLPACFIRNFMHAFGQLGDDASLFPALNFPTSKQRKLLPGLQIGRLGLSLHSSRTNLCAFSESLLKTFFFALSSWITSEMLADAGTVQNCILPFLFAHWLHQL